MEDNGSIRLSRRTIETLIDLAENRLTDVTPADPYGAREIEMLQSCVVELKSMKINTKQAPSPRSALKR
jgi:hypothetical protein